jgi:hypothetical protein
MVAAGGNNPTRQSLRMLGLLSSFSPTSAMDWVQPT